MTLDGLMDVGLPCQARLHGLAGEGFDIGYRFAVRGVGHGHFQDGFPVKPEGKDLVFGAEVAGEQAFCSWIVFLGDVDDRQFELGGQGFQELIAGDCPHFHQDSS